MSNLTLTIIKPDAVRNGHAGKIIDHIVQAGFRVRAMKMIHMNEREAGGFYNVHRERPFFNDLVAFMTGGPCIPMVLEKSNAVTDFRELIGATNPQEAAPWNHSPIICQIHRRQRHSWLRLGRKCPPRSELFFLPIGDF